MHALFRFPNPVNEIAARTVAAGVVVMCATFLIFQAPLVLGVLAYGFVARVATGPTLSPLGQLATRVIAPRLPVAPRPVPGPPKRFAQLMGSVFSLIALIAFALGYPIVTNVFVVFIVVAASLESGLGYCLGCKVFALLMRAGLISESVCEACNDLRLRTPPVPGN